MDLKEWEKQILLWFIEELSERYSNDGCNDSDCFLIDLIHQDKLVEIDRKYWAWNRTPENHDSNSPFIHKNNSMLLGYIEGRIKGEIE